MYIIDQHAAHEKVMFEKLMDRLSKKEVSSQMINPPIILNLSLNEANLINKYMDNFKEIGFEIEAFGGQDFAVRAVPAELYTLDSYDVLMQIIDNLSNENGRMVPDMITEKIASMSCKAAVKETINVYTGGKCINRSVAFIEENLITVSWKTYNYINESL